MNQRAKKTKIIHTLQFYWSIATHTPLHTLTLQADDLFHLLDWLCSCPSFRCLFHHLRTLHTQQLD